MSNIIVSTIEFWVSLGLYDVLLPFIFIYTIVYAILQKTKILGSYQNVNSLVSFCFGFIATASLQTVATVQTFFSAVGFFVVAGLCVMIIIGMFGLKSLNTGNKWYNKLPRIIVFSVIGLGLFYLVSVGLGFNNFIMNLIPSFSSVVTQTIIVGAVFVIIIWFIVGGGSASTSIKESKASSKNKDSDASKDTNMVLDKTISDSDSFEEMLKRKN